MDLGVSTHIELTKEHFRDIVYMGNEYTITDPDDPDHRIAVKLHGRLLSSNPHNWTMQSATDKHETTPSESTRVVMSLVFKAHGNRVGAALGHLLAVETHYAGEGTPTVLVAVFKYEPTQREKAILSRHGVNVHVMSP